MIVWAAIDVLDGRAVRLQEGRREALTDYGPAEAAVERWAAAGLTHLHVVDLDAAFGGGGRVEPLIFGARRRWPRLVLQVGGGVRTLEGARRLLSAGASRAVVGSPLFSDPAAAGRIVEALGPEACVAALDVRDGRVRVHGWTAEAATGLAESARMVRGMGFAEVLVTDIGRDGRLAGPNLELYRSLDGTGLRVVASGGVSSVQDLTALAALPNVGGAIVGKALYEGAIDASGLRELGR